MERPPRNPNAPLFGIGQIVFSVFEGFVSLMADTFGVRLLSLPRLR